MMADDKEMSLIAYLAALLLAIIIDLLGIFIPFIGTVFIVLMRASFWIIGYDLRGTTAMTVINALAEILPVVPSCTIFVYLSHSRNKKNIKERKKQSLNS